MNGREELILGIDPGLATTGYGVVRSTGPRSFELVDAGVIRTDSDDHKPVRLRELYQEMEALIEEYDPDGIGVEDLFFSSNKKTASMVAEARGVVLLAAADYDLSSYSPLEVKKQITGYGQANKRQMMTMVTRLLGLREPPKPDDAADGVGIALCKGLEVNSALNRQFGDRGGR